MKRYFTTAIDYVNSLPHIGTAYEKIGTDVLARFYRLQGDEVRLQMGVDEHSFNVQKVALAKGLTPQGYCNQMRPSFEDVWKKLGIIYDDFIQTSQPRHHEAVLAFFKRVYDKGDVYEKDYEGWYCESCEAFYLEKDLEDGLCKNHKSKPKWLKEKNYFFRLSRYGDAILKHINDNPNFILPEKRKNEIVNFIKEGLIDFSITRSTFSWGIPVPLNPKHVFYVWFEALINYVTTIGFGRDEKLFNQWWPHVTHVVGKDIIRFHCLIWPAMLFSAGLPMPRHIFGHGFVYLRGEKMSKSLGNVVTPLDILTKYPDFGADALRYYLMRGSSFGDDGNFTWDGFTLRYNADLANGIGNLASRVLGMVWKYQGGVVRHASCAVREDLLLAGAEEVGAEVVRLMDPVQSGDICCHLALEKIWAYISRVDQFVDITAPWQLVKENQTEKLGQALFVLVEAVRLVCILVYPFIPVAVQKVWLAYGFDKIKRLDEVRWSDLSMVLLKQDHQLAAQKLNLFPRIQMEKNTVRVDDVDPQSGHVSCAPTKSETTFVDIADFSKIDLRVAKITAAQKVEKADKLLLLQVDVAGESRQIVAGIAQHYKPEDLIGKSIVIVANLKPAKIRGIESHGMLLAAKDDKALFVVTPAGDMTSGARVG